MEIAGLAIGVVGLLTLYQEAANKLHSVKHFSSESLRLTSRYNATKILFERWAKQAGIADTHGSQKAVPPQLNDQATASAVADLLKSIRDVFANSDSTFARYHDQRPNDSDLARLSIRSRLQWAAGDSGKLSRQVEEFDDLVQKLYLLVPVEDLHRDQFWKLQDALFESQRTNALDRILRWLDAAASEDSFDAYCSARLNTTCNWVTTNATYLDWLSDQPPSSGKVLWVHGPAGFGKSVLCAYIIQLLRDTGKAPVYYSFCSAENESQRNPISILRTWILQAVHRNETVLDMVKNHLNSCETTLATHSDLWSLFHNLLSHEPNSTFVVDGLDECPRTSTSRTDLHRGREDILHELLNSFSNCGARLLVLSRDEGDIQAELGPHSPLRPGLILYQLALTKDLIVSDVARFAAHVVLQKLPEKPDEFQRELAAQMAEKSDGMFLMVRLQSRNLRPRKGNKQLQRIINEMPTDLVRIYERDWADIQNFSPSDRRRAETILRWVILARRPLTIAEVSEAASVLDNDEGDGPEFDELPDPFDEKFVHSEILGLCGSFLELRSSNTPDVWESQTVHVIHFSAVEFLSGQQSDGPFSDAMLHHHRLALACLRYLDHEDTWHPKKVEAQGVIYRRQFLKYAVSGWLGHFRKSEQYQGRIRPQLLSFFHVPNSNWDHWRQRYETYLGTVSATSRSEASCSTPGGRLYYASLIGSREVVEYLHSSRMADINEVGGFFGNPVQAASAMGDIDVLEFLLNAGADIHAHGRYGSALHAAVACNQEQATLRLLQHEASLSATDHGGKTPLLTAIFHGSQSSVRLLLSWGADLFVPDSEGRNSLHWAVRSGDVEIVKLLLRHNVDLSSADEAGETPLHISAKTGHADIVQVLLNVGADPKAANIDGDTALDYAAYCGFHEICLLLLDAGADIHKTHDTGLTCLHSAAHSGHHKVLEVLLDYGADLTICSHDGRAALHFAAVNGHNEAVRVLLEHGADPAARTDQGVTALHWAAWSGHDAVVRLLLDFDGKVNRAHADGWTPLHLAAQEGHRDIVDLLLQHGADVSATGNGWTPLHQAASRGHLEVVKRLLEASANISTTSTYGWTALHLASSEGHIEVVQLLLNAGANVHSLMYDGKTPLHLAFKGRHKDIVLALLDNEASLGSLDAYGMAPWEYAGVDFRANVPQSKDCKSPTRDSRQHKVRRSVQSMAAKAKPREKKDTTILNNLGSCLLLLHDSLSASVVYGQTIVIDPKYEGLLHAARCDGCQERVTGNRYACSACPDHDLCSSCFARYTEGADFDFSDVCAGHEYLRIPSDDWSVEETSDVYTEEFADWLKDLALRYQVRSS